jgi:hypothetical protein
MRAPSFEHGTRGPLTSNSAEPMRQRSPMRASVMSTPASVRFSPKAPGSSERPICSCQNSTSSHAYAYAALYGPPWLTRSACSSPASPVEPTATGPVAARLTIPDRTTWSPI